MRVAICADLHLTTREAHPERFDALDDILHQCQRREVQALVFAGDLFDQTQQNYAEFEAAFQAAADPELQGIVLPGNHDHDLTPSALSAGGVAVISEPQLMPVGQTLQLLLVPYEHGRTMGEAIAPMADQLPADRWILVGHGDWAQGLREPDPYEQGVYMPLTRADVERYRPMKALLGHIHRPYDGAIVSYVGSPCPLNINETGLRRFLLFDSDTREVQSILVDSSLVYFNETFVLLPVEDEVDYLNQLISERIAGWGLPEGWQDRVRLRVRISGYTRDKPRIAKAVRSAFESFAFYDEGGPDLSELSHTTDLDRDHIARRVRAWLEGLEWPPGPAEPDLDEIMAQALKTIYGP